MRGGPTEGSNRLSLTGMIEVDAACDRFEAELRAGRAPEIAATLAEVPAAVRTELLRELLLLELAYRFPSGQPPDAAGYLARFPEHRDVIDEVFHQFLPAGSGTISDRRTGAAAARRAMAHAARPSGEVSPEVVESLRSAGYEVLGELGRGGMGVVYLARQIVLNRPCAVKMILEGPHADPETFLRFLSEAETIARLRHPNIVEIHQFGRAGGLPFVELEYLAGGSLDQALDGTPWPVAKAVELIALLTRAVAEAHRLGVIHRDLKPGNVLLTIGGVPKVGDFGLARSLAFDSQLTLTGEVVGSPSYMTPEQAECRREAVGPATDVYSLGAILYELLTGRPPFKAATAIQTLDQVRSQEPIAPRQLQPALPRDLETICLKCLQKDPHRRYASADALAEDLDRWIHRRPILARPTGPAEQAWKWARRHPPVALLSAALIGITVLGFSLVAWQWRRAETKAAVAAAASNDARDARREAVKGQAQLALNHGLDLCEQTEIARGLLWLARSLELATEARADGLQRAIRINLAEWSSRFSRPEPRVRHPAPVLDLAFRPDGRVLVSAGEDGSLRSWDTTTWRELDPTPPDQRLGGPLRHGAEGSMSVTLSADGRTEVTGGEDGRVVLWEKATGRSLGSMAFDSPVEKVLFSRDGRRILAGTRGGRLHVWTPELARVSDLPPQGAAVTSLAASPEGRLFATGTEGGIVRLWDTTSLRQTGQTHKLTAGVRALVFGPDGQALAIGQDDGTIRTCAVPRTTTIGPALHTGGPVHALAFSRDGTRVLAGSARGAHCWDFAGRSVWGPADDGELIAATAFSPDRQTLAMALAVTTEGRARWRLTLRDAQTGVLLHESPELSDPPVGLTFSPSSREILTWGHGPLSASLWEVAALKRGRPLFRSLEVAIHQAAFSPDGRTLLLGCRDGKGRLWDVERDAENVRGSSPHHAYPITAVAFEPHFRRVVTGCHAGTVRLWDETNGMLLNDVRGNAGEIVSIAFSPDGKTLLTASLDATARCWDVESGRQLGPLMDHRDAVLSVAFHPDGTRLATGAKDGVVRLWHAPMPPARGRADELRRQVEAKTGLKLDEQGRGIRTQAELRRSVDGSRDGGDISPRKGVGS